MNSPPSTLGQYQIIREIARSNDIVYEAYDPLMNRRVAIKELAMPQGASGPQQEERISRFKREAQAAGTLNHPNIMTVFSFAEDAGRTFMAMEYLDGGTLRNEIDTKGFIPAERAIDIAIHILEGLSHAHSKGVIHRDIKPDNIQILANGTIKITDFGIARLTFQPNLTMDGQVFGTPSYMSPEQVVGREIDQRSDLFSVGVVLYEMVSGQKPFGGDSVVSITYAIMNAEPPKPAQADYALWQVISKALDKSPQVRYSNSDEMIRALKDALAASKSGIAGAVSGPIAAAPPVYGANPYMTPPPAPVQPVYSYNPYQPHPTMAPPSPYQTTPYQPSPYQGASYQTSPYPFQAGPSMQPPGQQLPIYYPPPPRLPLMKPETAAFLKKTALTLVLVGTLVAVILVGLTAFVDSMRNANNDNIDNNALPENLSQLPQNLPTTDKIGIAEKELTHRHSDGSKAEIRHYISMLYGQSGMQLLGRGDLAHAEFELGEGLKADPNNPSLWSGLGNVLKLESNVQMEPGRKASLLSDAGDDWTKAYGVETKSDRKQEDATAAAKAYLSSAQSALDSGDREIMGNARQKLYDVRNIIGNDSSTRSQIDEVLLKLS